MATRKPGFTDSNTNRNKRDSRVDPSTDNVTQSRWTTTNNVNRNRFINMPVTP